MHKPVLGIAAAGVLGFAIWKVLSFLLLPLMGTLFGLLFTVIKFALVVGLIFLVVWWFRKDKKEDGEAPSS